MLLLICVDPNAPWGKSTSFAAAVTDSALNTMKLISQCAMVLTDKHGQFLVCKYRNHETSADTGANPRGTGIQILETGARYVAGNWVLDGIE